jgi:hypothetical protein
MQYYWAWKTMRFMLMVMAMARWLLAGHWLLSRYW